MITDEQVRAAIKLLEQYVKEGRADDHRCVLAVVAGNDDGGHAWQAASGRDSDIASCLARFMLDDEDVMEMMTKMLGALLKLLQSEWKKHGEHGVLMGKKGMA